MKLITTYILIILSLGIFSQSSYNIVIDRVEVNGNLIEDYENLVLTTSDTIRFVFYNKIENAVETPFLFRTVLSRNEIDSAVKSINKGEMPYRNLPESSYIFEVSAFDIGKDWFAAPKRIKFEVDNQKAALIKKVAEYEQSFIQTSDLLDSLETSGSTSSGGVAWLQIILGFVVGGVLIGGLFAFLKKEKKESRSDQLLKDLASEDLAKNDSKTEELKVEIAALRSQIEGLQKRTSEMQSQNQDLENNIELLEGAKKELEKLQEQKDELFAILIHDIKNPAAIIKSLVELLKGYDLSAIDQQQVIEDIVSSTRQIVKLSQEISRVLVLESGKMEMNIKDVNLIQIAKQVHKRFAIKAEEKGMMFMFDESAQLPMVKADEQKIDEILSNLVSNAIKFTQQGGAVRIKAKQVDNSCVFEISDNGQGLNEDDLQKIFKKGTMLSARPTGGENSTGLGLWIVKTLVEAHNGKVWVRSSKGKGCTFAFSIPTDKTPSSQVTLN